MGKYVIQASQTWRKHILRLFAIKTHMIFLPYCACCYRDCIQGHLAIKILGDGSQKKHSSSTGGFRADLMLFSSSMLTKSASAFVPVANIAPTPR